MSTKQNLLLVLSSVLITLGLVTLLYGFTKPQELTSPGPITTVYECDYQDIKKIAEELEAIEASGESQLMELPEVTQ